MTTYHNSNDRLMRCGLTTRDIKRWLRHGPYAWPGGYPLYFVTADGAALSFETVRAEWPNICAATRSKDNNGWWVDAVDVNWEDGELLDDHTGQRIESAYAD